MTPDLVPDVAPTGDRPPWSELPHEVPLTIRPHLREIVEQMIAAIQRDVPAYARPLEGDFGSAVRQGVEVALSRLLLQLPGRAEPALTAEDRTVYRQLGRGEARAGRPLEALLSAYRIGARVAFRITSRLALETGLDPTVLLPLGESIFAYVDELSTASVEAFADEQFRKVGERDRRRGALLELVVAGRADEAELRAHAVAAEWSPPAEVVAVAAPPDQADGLRMALDERALLRVRSEHVVALVPAPVGTRGRAETDRALSGRRAWVGPARPWTRAGDSLDAALAGLSLEGDGGWPGAGVRWVEDHLATLVMGAAPELVLDLARIRLAPLEALRETQRLRLAETLLSWLRHQGERVKVAADLHVHPQTVGYRLGQLREVFGDALEDPLTRFELEMVLRAGHR